MDNSQLKLILLELNEIKKKYIEKIEEFERVKEKCKNYKDLSKKLKCNLEEKQKELNYLKTKSLDNNEEEIKKLKKKINQQEKNISNLESENKKIKLILNSSSIQSDNLNEIDNEQKNNEKFDKIENLIKDINNLVIS